MAKRISERMTFSGTVGGTDAAPVVENVLLCGPTSANKRRYKREAFAGERVKRYNGKPVFLNHGRGSDGRPYQEQIGTIQNARHRESDGMPVGDIAINPHKPCALAFVWDARHQPKACGMSHVAHCETTRASDGWEEVTEMVEPESVDVISANGAATTKGLFESTRSRAVNFSLKQFVERFGPKWGAKKWGAATKLCEDMGAVADAPVMDEPPADVADGDLKSALMSAITPLLDEAFESGDSGKVCSAIKDFIKLHAKHTGKDTGGSGSSNDDDPEYGKESKPTAADVLKECKAKAPTWAPTADDLVILTGITDPATRATYIESHAKAPGHRPTGTSRRPEAGGGKPPVKESTAPAKAPAIPKWDDL